jgi:hypothetical protein
MCACSQRMGLILVRSRQRAEVMALSKSYNVDISGNKVGLEPSGCDDGTDLKVLRVPVLGSHGECSYK